MTALKKGRLDEAIKEAVSIRKRKILGICLGLQMLASSSTEDGMTSGLNYIPGVVERFSLDELRGQKLPHVGFNKVSMPNSNGLFKGLAQESYFYFVHSYRLLPQNLPGDVAQSNYGIDFVAAYQHENVFAAQFHPEKSQTNGLRLLDNFIAC
jgi:glutamine amidotransferase